MEDICYFSFTTTTTTTTTTTLMTAIRASSWGLPFCRLTWTAHCLATYLKANSTYISHWGDIKRLATGDGSGDHDDIIIIIISSSLPFETIHISLVHQQGFFTSPQTFSINTIFIITVTIMMIQDSPPDAAWPSLVSQSSQAPRWFVPAFLLPPTLLE